MKGKINTFNKYLILTFLTILPMLDLKLFYSRVTTLVEVLIIVLSLLILLVFNYKVTKKTKLLFLYYLLSFVYLFINYKRSFSFNSYFPNNFNYSIYKETLTVIKLLMPITLYFILKNMDINKKTYIKIIYIWSLFISLMIIVTDIFKVGFSSYSNELIKYNIFEWRTNIYYIFTACKGYFNYANQEACLLLMLLLTNIYYYVYKKENNYHIIVLLSISMLILGTRTSTLGGLLLLIFMCLFSAFKSKFNDYKYLLIIIVFWTLLLPISPFFNRNIELLKKRKEVNVQIERIIYESSTIEKGLTDNKEKLINYFDKNVDNSVLPEIFYKDYYSYYNDPVFWVDYIKNNSIQTINYRKTEISIIRRIIKVNNNKYDYYFGIGNSRIQNVVNVERDFVLQFFAYGIIGTIILLSPYIYLLYCLIKKYIKEKSLYNIIVLGVYLLFVISCFLTGNILNFLSCTLPFIFIYNGINIKELK